jgi:hypothetical protein
VANAWASSAGRFLVDHLQGDRHEPLELFVAGLRQQRLRPHVILGARVTVEQPPDEGYQRDPLQLTAALRLRHVVRVAQHRLEAVCIAQRLGRQRRDDLTEADVRVRERRRLALRAEKDRADDRALPPNGHDDDRAHIAQMQRVAHAAKHRVGCGVGDEDRLAALECALQFGVSVEVDDQVADRRVLVACDETDLFLLATEEDRAAVQPEALTELARDRLQNVDEVQGGGDLLQDVDDRD